MSIDIDSELEKAIKKVVSERNYPEQVNVYILSIVSQLRNKGQIHEGDLKDLLERIGKLVGED